MCYPASLLTGTVLRPGPIIVLFYGPDLIIHANQAFKDYIGRDPNGLPLRAVHAWPEVGAFVMEVRHTGLSVCAYIQSERTAGILTLHPLPEFDAVGTHFRMLRVRTGEPLPQHASFALRGPGLLGHQGVRREG